jgi:hypothetical protein
LIGGEGRLLDPDQAPARTRRRLSTDEERATANIADMSTLDVIELPVVLLRCEAMPREVVE